MDSSWYQQGDVLVFSFGKSVPQGEVKPDGIVAEGEATGHAHRVKGQDATLIQTEDGTRYLKAPLGATITHEEHLPITLPPGDYVFRGVQEYDHFAEEARRVAD